MQFEVAAETLTGIPHTRPEYARALYDFILASKPRRILELGTGHGVTACYMAAALDELGRGRVLTLDRRGPDDLDPHVTQLADKLRLTGYITTVQSKASFTWDLRNMLAEGVEQFDFVFNDGGHTWDVAGLTFFLTDKLLRPGGWMLFDDLNWTLAGSPTLSNADWVRKLPEDQQQSAQVGQVFDLLVRQHSSYTDFQVQHNGKWGWARKRRRRWLS